MGALCTLYSVALQLLSLWLLWSIWFLKDSPMSLKLKHILKSNIQCNCTLPISSLSKRSPILHLPALGKKPSVPSASSASSAPSLEPRSSDKNSQNDYRSKRKRTSSPVEEDSPKRHKLKKQDTVSSGENLAHAESSSVVSTPVPQHHTTVVASLGSPGNYQEIKTAGAIEMELEQEVPPSLPYLPLTSAPDDSASVPSAASGPPSSQINTPRDDLREEPFTQEVSQQPMDQPTNTVPVSNEGTEDASTDPPSTSCLPASPAKSISRSEALVSLAPEPEAGPSKKPLFLPDDDDDDITNSLNVATGHAFGLYADYLQSGEDNNDLLDVEREDAGSFVLDSRLLPEQVSPHPPSTTIVPTRRGIAMVVSDDEVDFLHSRETSNRSPAVSSVGPARKQGKHQLPRRQAVHRRSASVLSHVEMPPPPSYVRFLAEKRKRGSASPEKSKGTVNAGEEDGGQESAEVRSKPGEMNLPIVIEDDDRVMTPPKQSTVLDDEERSIRDIAFTRLRELNCGWRGCNAILGSARALAIHASTHAKDREEFGTYICKWEGCTRAKPLGDAVKLGQHLKQHASELMYCPYEGCERTFARGDLQELVRHFKSPRHREGRLRPVNEPRQSESIQTPPMPAVLPSYMSVPCVVKKHQMDEDRHYALGAQVLASVLCYAPPGTRSRQVVPFRPTRQIPASFARIEEYLRESPEAAKEYILKKIREKNRTVSTTHGAPEYCDPLPSEQVTRMVARGIVFQDPDHPGDELGDFESVASDEEEIDEPSSAIMDDTAAEGRAEPPSQAAHALPGSPTGGRDIELGDDDAEGSVDDTDRLSEPRWATLAGATEVAEAEVMAESSRDGP
ncbi:hypothetical protein K474DRAFT_536163 [Panus rudis PR-1116 ss-1]|nr:hypothetical protein K474DRAFT_536163 [Panus rudis PR-1116 ss-1]